MCRSRYSNDPKSYGSRGGSASERKVRVRLPRWQPGSVSLAIGVRSADTVLLTVIVHFQVVGHLLTAFVITQHGQVGWVMKLKELHVRILR
jgi:hypothetical protein